MHRFEGEKRLLFTERRRNEKFALGLENQEVGNKVMWQTEGRCKGSREIGRRESDCEQRGIQNQWQNENIVKLIDSGIHCRQQT